MLTEYELMIIFLFVYLSSDMLGGLEWNFICYLSIRSGPDLGYTKFWRVVYWKQNFSKPSKLWKNIKHFSFFFLVINEIWTFGTSNAGAQFKL